MQAFIEKTDSPVFVKDIEPFKLNGEIPIDDEIMQELCIEKPIRKACVSLTQNGIPTIMSSANRENVERRAEPINEKELYIGTNDPWTIGNGYAWIMIPWNNLDEINRAYFLNMCSSSKRCKEFIKFYEYFEVAREQARSYNYDVSEIIKNLHIQLDTGEKQYDSMKKPLLGSNSLSNYKPKGENGGVKTLVIRYPVNETTEVSEVESFFARISETIINNHQRALLHNTDKNTLPFGFSEGPDSH